MYSGSWCAVASGDGGDAHRRSVFTYAPSGKAATLVTVSFMGLATRCHPLLANAEDSAEKARRKMRRCDAESVVHDVPSLFVSGQSWPGVMCGPPMSKPRALCHSRQVWAKPANGSPRSDPSHGKHRAGARGNIDRCLRRCPRIEALDPRLQGVEDNLHAAEVLESFWESKSGPLQHGG